MLIYALLFYIGRELSAPYWYWVFFSLSAYFKFFVWVLKVAKAGEKL